VRCAFQKRRSTNTLAEATREYNGSLHSLQSSLRAFAPDSGKDSGSIHDLAAISFMGTENDFLAQLCKPEPFQRFLFSLGSFATFAVKAFDSQFPLFGNLGDFGILFFSAPPCLRGEILLFAIPLIPPRSRPPHLHSVAALLRSPRVDVFADIGAAPCEEFPCRCRGRYARA
jgi:hypothetical protein